MSFFGHLDKDTTALLISKILTINHRSTQFSNVLFTCQFTLKTDAEKTDISFSRCHQSEAFLAQGHQVYRDQGIIPGYSREHQSCQRFQADPVHPGSPLGLVSQEPLWLRALPVVPQHL